MGCFSCLSCDQYFFIILAIGLICAVYIDLSVLRSMLEEFILVGNYLDPLTYQNCYKLQT